MINRDSNLTIITKIVGQNPSFSDLIDCSAVAGEFDRDQFNMGIGTGGTMGQGGTDCVFIGYRKPIDCFYINLNSVNTGGGNLLIQFWNGTAWTNVTTQFDETQNMSRSGFVTWDRNQINETQTTVGTSAPMFFYKLTTSYAFSGDDNVTVNGLNILFADDEDLRKECPTIMNPSFLDGKTTYVVIHQAVRDMIIQKLRNQDNTVRQQARFKALTAWDLLYVDEVKQGAIYLALSKIYFNFIRAQGDMFDLKAKYYMDWYLDQINLARLSIDSDDTGLDTPAKTQQQSRNMILTR